MEAEEHADERQDGSSRRHGELAVRRRENRLGDKKENEDERRSLQQGALRKPDLGPKAEGLRHDKVAKPHEQDDTQGDPGLHDRVGKDQSGFFDIDARNFGGVREQLLQVEVPMIW